MNPSTKRGLQRKRRILEAASALFLQNGFGETSVNMIIARSGGSKATFYRYFRSKGELLRAVVGSIVSHREEPKLETSEDFQTELRTFAEKRLRVVFSHQHQALLRLIVAERLRFPDIARTYFELGPKRSHDRLAKFMLTLQANGVLEVGSAQDAAEFFIGMLMHEWYINALYVDFRSPTSEEMSQRAQHVTVRFLRAFQVSTRGR